MTDEELQQRANIYARGVIEPLMRGDSPVNGVAVALTLIARAFVIGFAAGVEDATLEARRTVKRPRQPLSG